MKHTIIISQDVNGNFISEDEAHYINAILNSSIVHEYIHSTFKTNGFSLKKANLFIPKYKQSNRLHHRLVVISKFASMPSNKNKREKASAIASLVYARLSKEENVSLVSKPYKLPEMEENWKVAEEVLDRRK